VANVSPPKTRCKQKSHFSQLKTTTVVDREHAAEDKQQASRLLMSLSVTETLEFQTRFKPKLCLKPNQYANVN